MVQVARGVGVVGAEGGDVLCHSPQECQDAVLHHFRRREAVEAPVVHRRQAQPVFALQGEFIVQLQLESQVGDGVCRQYRVPWVVQVWAEAQLQARDPLLGGHGALAGVELHAHHPEVPDHRLQPSTKCCSVWAWMRPLLASPGGRRRCSWARSRGSRRSACSRSFRGCPVGRRTACGLAVSACVPWRCAVGLRCGGRQEVNDLRRQGEVEQDEVECAVRGAVEGLAGVEGEDIVGPSPLELPLRHEQEGRGIGAREGLLLPIANHAASREHLRDALGAGAREQLHVQLA